MGNERLVRRARSQQLGDLLRRSAARVPNKTALVFRDQSDTFAELDAAVNRAANALRARGISKGTGSRCSPTTTAALSCCALRSRGWGRLRRR